MPWPIASPLILAIALLQTLAVIPKPEGAALWFAIRRKTFGLQGHPKGHAPTMGAHPALPSVRLKESAFRIPRCPPAALDRRTLHNLSRRFQMMATRRPRGGPAGPQVTPKLHPGG